MQTKGNSNAMEMIGFKEGMMQVLNVWKLKVKNMITDRHIQIRAYMRDVYGVARKQAGGPIITHYLDIWHVAKSKYSNYNILYFIILDVLYF